MCRKGKKTVYRYGEKSDRVGSFVNNVYPDLCCNQSLYKMFSMYEPQLTGKRRPKALMDVEICKSPRYIEDRLFNPHMSKRRLNSWEI